jgi:hypothetical protein
LTSTIRAAQKNGQLHLFVSLNASVEPAHAGTTGCGFAIVAAKCGRSLRIPKNCPETTGPSVQTPPPRRHAPPFLFPVRHNIRNPETSTDVWNRR